MFDTDVSLNSLEDVALYFEVIQKSNNPENVRTTQRSMLVNVTAILIKNPESPAFVCLMYTRYTASVAEKDEAKRSIRMGTHLFKLY